MNKTIIYRDGALERILNDYGYMDGEGGWHHYIKDYQGNVRAVIDHYGTLEEVNNYYPYGALMGGGTVNNPGIQPYKYGTKEFDRQNGLDWYDSQARMYDPLLGRTPTLDPLAEKYYPISPYAWCGGNAIRRIDMNGMDWYETNTGVVQWDASVTSSDNAPSGSKYLGPTYKGLSVLMYQAEEHGLKILVGYKSDEGENTEYHWIQSVNTNSPKEGKTSPYIDTENEDNPFYYTEEEEKKQSNKDGQDTVFEDWPEREFVNDTWQADLSVVKEEGDKYVPLVSIRYGFKIAEHSTKLEGIRVIEMSSTVATSLDKYEQEKKTNEN